MTHTHQRLVMLDFDGTIADTFAAYIDIYNSVIAPSFGSRPHDSGMMDRMREVPLAELLREYRIPKLQLPLMVLKARRELSRRIPDIAVCAGMRSALSQLHTASITVGIVTTNSRGNVQAFLHHHDLAQHVDFIRTRRDPFGKARALRAVVRSQGLSRDTAVYVGDEARDVRAGKAAGIRTIAVTWGLSSAEALSRERPDALVTSAQELVAAVGACSQ